MTMTNRKEVAEKIRKCGVWLLDVSLKDKSVQAFAVLANAIGVEGNYSLIFNRLADLINPTCKYLPITYATWFDDNDEEHEDTSLEALGNSENAYCSFCGYEMMTGEEGWFDYERKEHGNHLIPLFNLLSWMWCKGGAR